VKNVIKRLAKGAVDLAVVMPAKRSSWVRHLLAYAAEQACPRLPGHSYYDKMAAYERLKDLFINNGPSSSPYDRSVRATVVERFERIDREIDIQTTAMDGLFLAEALLSLQSPGAIVECGCFNGGSTAKLSIVGDIMGREVFVFDSFEGLPSVDPYNARDLHMRRSAQIKRDWKPGEYAASLEHVKNNVLSYGVIDRCTFIKGWFNETLPRHLPPQIALAFTDVDVPSSAKECLVSIWPKISEGGVFFSHDIAYIKVIQNFVDEELWKNTLHEHPPIFWGAGYGMGDGSPHLGFAVKGPMTAEYVKNLSPYR
jgi:O-methyltransferase